MNLRPLAIHEPEPPLFMSKRKERRNTETAKRAARATPDTRGEEAGEERTDRSPRPGHGDAARPEAPSRPRASSWSEDDEQPGASLVALRVPRGLVAWSVAQLVLALLLAVIRTVIRIADATADAPIPALAQLDFPLRVAWRMLPFVTTVSLLATLFIVANQIAQESTERRRGARCVWLQVLTLVVWLATVWALKVTSS